MLRNSNICNDNNLYRIRNNSYFPVPRIILGTIFLFNVMKHIFRLKQLFYSRDQWIFFMQICIHNKYK